MPCCRASRWSATARATRPTCCAFFRSRFAKPFLVFFRALDDGAALIGGFAGAALASGLLEVPVDTLMQAQHWDQALGGFYFVPKDGASAHGTLAAFAWALLAYGLLMSIMRLPRTVGVLALVLLSGGVAYHYLPSSEPREIAIVAGFVFALVVFVASAWFPALQWLLGFAAIGFAACWTSGELAVGGARTTEVDIWTMALLICLALLLALWQASPASSRVERRVRAEISKVIARRKKREAAAGAQCDGDAPARE